MVWNGTVPCVFFTLPNWNSLVCSFIVTWEINGKLIQLCRSSISSVVQSTEVTNIYMQINIICEVKAKSKTKLFLHNNNNLRVCFPDYYRIFSGLKRKKASYIHTYIVLRRTKISESLQKVKNRKKCLPTPILLRFT